MYSNQSQLPPTVDWDGFYIGIIGGGGGGTSFNEFSSVPISGQSIGLRGGFDVQVDNLVFGAAISVERAWIAGSNPCFNTAFTCEGELEVLGRAEGRLGFAADAALVYLKGDAVFAYGRADTDPTFSDYYSSSWGWSVGAGAEVMLADNISVFAEYSYVDLMAHVAPAGTVNNVASTIDPEFHIINAGINYRF